MKGKIWSKIGEGLVKIGTKMKYHSPAILIGTGLVTGATTVVMACVATRKTEPVMSDSKRKVAKIHKDQEKGIIIVTDDAGNQLRAAYTEKDVRKDLTKVYINTGWELVKIYLPAMGMGALSTVSILSGANILKKRNVALLAAYTTVDNSYKQYRSRVADKYGEEAEKELRNGLTVGYITEKVMDEETGKEKKVKKQVLLAGDAPSDYARYFEHGATEHWEPSHDYNMMYLRGQQNTANDLLRVRKWLYLNDIYEMLGLKHSIAGQEVGWVYDPDLGKDNFIDFGIQEVYRPSDDDPSKLVPTILLDFNVDGPVSAKALQLNLIEG